MARDYAAAVEALNSLQSNYATLKAIRDTGRYGANDLAIPEMVEWCRRLGYEPSALNKLNVIHISGTKGKGSTSAFISSILSQYPSRKSSSTPDNLQSPSPSTAPTSPLKVGLYTSPHLRTVRERIRIDNSPLPPHLFAKYFFETWDRISHSSHESELLPSPDQHAKPNYFRFLTLTAFHAFLSEKVDVAIMECGMGGAYDSTNIVPAPAITAVTSLGMDHLDQLGHIIENIAWHKSGIFKEASPSATVYASASQPAPALEVLERRARDQGKTLQLIHTHPSIANNEVPISLEANFQKLNASLAVAVSSAFLSQQDGTLQLPQPGSSDPLPKQFQTGLAQTKWAGRCEVRHDDKAGLNWYIDGAHTLESVPLLASWYNTHIAQEHEPSSPRILLFNQQTRDAVALIRSLYHELHQQGRMPFTHALFCTNTPYPPDHPKLVAGSGDASLVNRTADETAMESLSVQCALAEVMKGLDEHVETHVLKNVHEAVALCRVIAGRGGQTHAGVQEAQARERQAAEQRTDKGDRTSVLVTGSLHLVGSVLEVLEGEEEEEEEEDKGAGMAAWRSTRA
ncbi:MAG: hypothetical protein Q9162_004976 [Coniocarpon cinnabarinum]